MNYESDSFYCDRCGTVAIAGEHDCEDYCAACEDSPTGRCEDCYDGPPDDDSWGGGFTRNH